MSSLDEQRVQRKRQLTAALGAVLGVVLLAVAATVYRATGSYLVGFGILAGGLLALVLWQRAARREVG